MKLKRTYETKRMIFFRKFDIVFFFGILLLSASLILFQKDVFLIIQDFWYHAPGLDMKLSLMVYILFVALLKSVPFLTIYYAIRLAIKYQDKA